MEIVLTQDVVGLGDVGQRVVVKSGYARNFLLPQGMAVEIGSSSARQAAHKMKQVEAKKKRFKVEADKLVQKLNDIKLELELRVGKSGKVFGSLSARDIAAKLKEKDFDIDRRRVLLVEPIKKIGQQDIKIKLHPEVTTEIKIDVKAINPTKEEEKQEALEARNKIDSVSEQKASEQGDMENSEVLDDNASEQEAVSSEAVEAKKEDTPEE